MAKVKFSALVSEMRNKLNGSVFSKNRGGNYLRNKVTPVNPSTSRQVLVRSRLGGLASGFRALGAALIAAWNSASENFPYTDIFGDQKTLSGSQLYTKLNLNLMNAGATQITSPPLPTGVAALLTLTLSVAAGGAKTIAFTASPVPAGTALVVEMTRGLSPGVSFVKNEYRFIKAVPAAGTSPATLTSEWNAKFGSVTAGQKVFVRAFMVNALTGEVSQALSNSTLAI